MPVYCATKSAIHFFTISLRHQLKDTSIKVFEIIPPTTDTDLDRGRRAGFRGIPPEEIAKTTIEAIANDNFEIAVGMAENLRKENFEENFNRMNH